MGVNPSVTLVIPGRNCVGTLRACLEAIAQIVADGASGLREVIFVDDGSTDESARIAQEFAARLGCLRVVTGVGGGPGAARNLGWRAACHPLIWFIDSDCVAEPDALARLLPHIDDSRVGGVGGSYGNMRPDSLLACLIHEEIVARHRSMRTDVNFLGGFNVLYRREALECAGGFDERFFNGPGSPGAEDAELSFRVATLGYALRFELESRVGHFHPSSLGRYLRAQRHHGYWRVFLHMRYRARAAGDDYSKWTDHVQPPLAVWMIVATLVFIASQFPGWPGHVAGSSTGVLESASDKVRLIGPAAGWMVVICAMLLAVVQIPLTLRLVRHVGKWSHVAFAPLGFVRAMWRAVGMVQGMLAYPFRGPRRVGGDGS